MNATSANDKGMSATMKRLAQFGAWTETTPPTQILGDDGEPASVLLAYCKDTGLSIDWLFCGDPASWARQSFQRAKTETVAPGWSEAFYDTDQLLYRLHGMTTVLHEVATEFQGLANPHPLAHGILTMIRVINDDAHAAAKLHEAEWRAQYPQKD